MKKIIISTVTISLLSPLFSSPIHAYNPPTEQIYKIKANYFQNKPLKITIKKGKHQNHLTLGGASKLIGLFKVIFEAKTAEKQAIQKQSQQEFKQRLNIYNKGGDVLAIEKLLKMDTYKNQVKRAKTPQDLMRIYWHIEDFGVEKYGDNLNISFYRLLNDIEDLVGDDVLKMYGESKGQYNFMIDAILKKGEKNV